MSINKKKIRREILFNGQRIWITANTEQEYAEKLLRLSANPTGYTGGKHLFKEYATEWFEVFSRPNVEKVTSSVYEQQLKNHILPILGDLNLEDITSADVQRVFNRMPEGTKQETKNKAKTVINQIFKKAIDDGLLLRNPLHSSSIRIKGEAASETLPYTVEQMRYLVEHLPDIKNPTDRTWLALSLSLPLRPEEVLGLRWVDVDTDGCTVHIRSTVTHPTRNEPEFKPYTKTTASIRELKFPKEILSFLPTRGSPEEFVVGGKNPISYTQLRGIRKRINRDTGFGETITPRRFRTTVATDISAMTHDLKLVQRSLGHATPQMTLKHYDKGRKNAIDAASAIGKCYGIGGN